MAQNSACLATHYRRAMLANHPILGELWLLQIDAAIAGWFSALVSRLSKQQC